MRILKNIGIALLIIAIFAGIIFGGIMLRKGHIGIVKDRVEDDTNKYVIKALSNTLDQADVINDENDLFYLLQAFRSGSVTLKVTDNTVPYIIQNKYYANSEDGAYANQFAVASGNQEQILDVYINKDAMCISTGDTYVGTGNAYGFEFSTFESDISDFEWSSLGTTTMAIKREYGPVIAVLSHILNDSDSKKLFLEDFEKILEKSNSKVESTSVISGYDVYKCVNVTYDLHKPSVGETLNRYSETEFGKAILTLLEADPADIEDDITLIGMAKKALLILEDPEANVRVHFALSDDTEHIICSTVTITGVVNGKEEKVEFFIDIGPDMHNSQKQEFRVSTTRLNGTAVDLSYQLERIPGVDTFDLRMAYVTNEGGKESKTEAQIAWDKSLDTFIANFKNGSMDVTFTGECKIEHQTQTFTAKRMKVGNVESKVSIELKFKPKDKCPSMPAYSNLFALSDDAFTAFFEDVNIDLSKYLEE